MRAPRVLLLSLFAAGLLAAPAHADNLKETVKVPTKDGRIWAEIVRPDTKEKVPIILTYSPYNSLGETPGSSVADDSLAATYTPKGYARVVADVLGTRNSTGCRDYGGPQGTAAG